jgi:hypothetical protein
MGYVDGILEFSGAKEGVRSRDRDRTWTFQRSTYHFPNKQTEIPSWSIGKTHPSPPPKARRAYGISSNLF